ncbi:hypothetical protein [Saccharopolyspora sp. NPDC002376]
MTVRNRNAGGVQHNHTSLTCLPGCTGDHDPDDPAQRCVVRIADVATARTDTALSVQAERIVASGTTERLITVARIVRETGAEPVEMTTNQARAIGLLLIEAANVAERAN